jgi:16S rRNA (adenine1518-N6/adenine1519-N6)-dimethyltransferase
MRSRPKTPSGFLRLAPRDSEEPVSEGKRLRQRLESYGVRPRKRWGQNFLIRPEIAQRIVDVCALSSDRVVVEIGPGAGALTGHLGAAARQVIAIERDRGLAALLRDELGDWAKVQVLEADFLETDLNALALESDAGKLFVVGNLPYAITTPIFTRLIEERAVIEQAVILVQREYAARLAAAAGSKDYGSLTVYARFYCILEPLFHVPPSAFWPKPEVESTLVRVRFRSRPPVEVPDETRFFELVRASFGQRRKTIANAVATAYEGERGLAARVLQAARVPGARRGETLDIEEFARLARADAKVRERVGGGE